jgi:RimJ/RimL family protein N-acetyltransferase
MNDQRRKWREDPRINRYFTTDPLVAKGESQELEPSYFEIYHDGKLVGDIKVFQLEKDVEKDQAQVVILIGEPVIRGIGTEAIALLIGAIRDRYASIYCLVNRYNIASIKMLQHNGFKIRDFRGNEVRLSRRLS